MIGLTLMQEYLENSIALGKVEENQFKLLVKKSEEAGVKQDTYMVLHKTYAKSFS
jgi:hypothetical protein